MPPQNVTPPSIPPASQLGTPSPKAQSWGALISIVVIMLMIIIGAFYAWGKRVAEVNALTAPSAAE